MKPHLSLATLFWIVTHLLHTCRLTYSFNVVRCATSIASQRSQRILMTTDEENEDSNEEDIDVSMEAFQTRKKDLQDAEEKRVLEEEEAEFDGYALRDVILEKWGLCYDVDFNRVDSFGFRALYLNILPFHLGGRRFRHETELDYLCHLQAVVEILRKYEQIGYVLVQIDETEKKPRGGTSPLVAVPLRLDLTSEEVTQILGY